MGTEADTGSWDRVLLICGVIAGPLFVVAFLAQGAIRPDYNPLRHSISTLALGSDLGWVQSLNFIIANSSPLAKRERDARGWGVIAILLGGAL